MEQQLFTWEDWQQDDTAAFGFNNVTLVKQIGEFPIGKKFEHACLNYETGILRFYIFTKDGNVDRYFEFKLSLTVEPVTEKIDRSPTML